SVDGSSVGSGIASDGGEAVDSSMLLCLELFFLLSCRCLKGDRQRSLKTESESTRKEREKERERERVTYEHYLQAAPTTPPLQQRDCYCALHKHTIHIRPQKKRSA